MLQNNNITIEYNSVVNGGMVLKIKETLLYILVVIIVVVVLKGGRMI